jgi:hypothetical protein
MGERLGNFRAGLLMDLPIVNLKSPCMSGRRRTWPISTAVKRVIWAKTRRTERFRCDLKRHASSCQRWEFAAQSCCDPNSALTYLSPRRTPPYRRSLTPT